MPTPPLQVEPVKIGPTWQRDEDGKWILPARSLGWQAIQWAAEWLQHETGKPWRYTPEQARFILHWFAVDDNDRFVYRDGVLQRLKGWGRPRAKIRSAPLSARSSSSAPVE